MNWINVNDSLPQETGKYLVTDGDDVEIMAFFGTYKDSPDWSSYACNTLDVTHWMPLPPLPLSK